MSDQHVFQIQLEDLIHFLAQRRAEPAGRRGETEPPGPRISIAVDPAAPEIRITGIGPEHARFLRMLDPAPADVATDPQPSYLACSVSLPEGEPRSEEIFAALRSVLEDKPYYWQVLRADSPPADSELPLDLDEPPAHAALHVAVFAGPRLNPGLVNEVSISQILGLPQLILCDEDHPELPSSFADVPRQTVCGLGEMLREEVLTGLAEHPEVCRFREHERYLSPSVLAWCAGIDETAGSAISARYPTWPAFLEAEPAEIASAAGIAVALVEEAKSGLRLLAEDE